MRTKRKKAFEFEGLPPNPLLTDKRRAFLRRRYGHRIRTLRKKPRSMYLPWKVWLALTRRLKEVDREGGYTPAYEYLAKMGFLDIDW